MQRMDEQDVELVLSGSPSTPDTASSSTVTLVDDHRSESLSLTWKNYPPSRPRRDLSSRIRWWTGFSGSFVRRLWVSMIWKTVGDVISISTGITLLILSSTTFRNAKDPSRSQAETCPSEVIGLSIWLGLLTVENLVRISGIRAMLFANLLVVWNRLRMEKVQEIALARHVGGGVTERRDVVVPLIFPDPNSPSPSLTPTEASKLSQEAPLPTRLPKRALTSPRPLLNSYQKRIKLCILVEHLKYPLHPAIITTLRIATTDRRGCWDEAKELDAVYNGFLAMGYFWVAAFYFKSIRMDLKRNPRWLPVINSFRRFLRLTPIPEPDPNNTSQETSQRAPPLSSEVVARIPVVTVTIEHREGDDSGFSMYDIQIPENQTTCSICLNDFQDKDGLRLLECGHVFHSACLDPWLLQVSGRCPKCQREVDVDGFWMLRSKGVTMGP